MRKIFKTIIVASLAALAMPLSASTMQTYTASSDSIDTTVEPADTLREKLAQMETRMASMEQEQEMQKTWKRRKYWKIGLSGNLVGISINLCKSIQKELFINDAP